MNTENKTARLFFCYCTRYESKGVDYFWKSVLTFIKMYLKETGCDGVEWINLAQDRLQWQALEKTAMNLRVP